MVAIISKLFRARYITHEVSKLRKSEFFVLLFLLFFSYQHLFYYLVLLLVSICSAIVGFISIY